MYEHELGQAYERLAAAWRDVLAAGGPARCNGEWARWAGLRNRIAQSEERIAYEAARERAETKQRWNGDEQETETVAGTGG